MNKKRKKRILFDLFLLGHRAEYINEHKLEQDHPCVIELIRRMFLSPPSPLYVPYNITDITLNNVPGPVERELKETQDYLLRNKVSFYKYIFIFLYNINCIFVTFYQIL